MRPERGALIALLVARTLRLQALNLLDLAVEIQECGARHVAMVLLDRASAIEHVAGVIERLRELAGEDLIRHRAIHALRDASEWLSRNLPIVNEHLEAISAVQRDRDGRVRWVRALES